MDEFDKLIILNYTGEVVRLDRTFAENRVGEKLRKSDRFITLHPLGRAYVEESIVKAPLERHSTVVYTVRGLPEPMRNTACLVNEEVAVTATGTRNDLMVPIDFEVRRLNKKRKRATYELICGDIAFVTVESAFE